MCGGGGWGVVIDRAVGNNEEIPAGHLATCPLDVQVECGFVASSASRADTQTASTAMLERRYLSGGRDWSSPQALMNGQSRTG